MKPTLIPRVLLFAAATLFTLTFTACGGSDDDDTPAPLTTPDLADETFTIEGVQFKMVGVKGGTFQMGSTDGLDDEVPVHSVSVSSFRIGETEVTQELWTAVMGKAPVISDAFSVGDKKPAVSVSWDECQTFIKQLNAKTGRTFRLPTEAEWEFAARGGTKSKGYTYSGSNTVGNVAWYSENSGLHAQKVAGKAPNELGLYDMSGNAREMCQDWYGPYSADAQVNPTGPKKGSYRVVRGGGHASEAASSRTTLRSYAPTTSKNIETGLRLAM